jgi:hypothetical protein
MVVPQTTHSPANTVQRCRNVSASLAGSGTFETKESLQPLVIDWMEPMPQKSVDQRHQAQQFETRFPGPRARTFHG